MPIETEIKLRTNAHDSLRIRLTAAGAVRRGMVIETNRMFDRPDGSLRAEHRGLRLRTSRPAGSEEHERSTLTYKGPPLPGGIKRREEFELRVDSAETASALLNALGFALTLAFEKRRETWHLGPCNVELDELPLIGRFIEIEGPGEADVHAALTALELSAAEAVPQTYAAMIADACARLGLDPHWVPLNRTPE